MLGEFFQKMKVLRREVGAQSVNDGKRFVALGVLLSILLLLAWADIALDAGLVKVNSVKPVTHFFSN